LHCSKQSINPLPLSGTATSLFEAIAFTTPLLLSPVAFAASKIEIGLKYISCPPCIRTNHSKNSGFHRETRCGLEK
jgi:hypothetical protein